MRKDLNPIDIDHSDQRKASLMMMSCMHFEESAWQLLTFGRLGTLGEDLAALHQACICFEVLKLVEVVPEYLKC